MSTAAIGSTERERLRNATQNASETLAEEIHRESVSSGEDVYNAIRQHLTGTGLAFEIARRFTLWVIRNFLAIQQQVRRGVSIGLTAMGELLAAATWWQVLAAAVGGLVVGGVACAVAQGLGAPPRAAIGIGILAGVAWFFGTLAAILV